MNRTAVTCTTILSAALVAGAALLSSSVTAGPLDPPAGPIAPTYKTLSEVEPRIAISEANTPGDAECLFRITQPGSYYLTGNVTGVAGKHGIVIAASGVTVDLNGFDLVGSWNLGFCYGVTVNFTDLRNIAVVNGSIRNWGAYGVGLHSAKSSRVERIRASGNAYSGILVDTGSTVVDCVAFKNGGRGIEGSNGCSIDRCASYENGSVGFFLDTAGAIRDCVASRNGAHGIQGLYMTVISDCNSTKNGIAGIYGGVASNVSRCSSSENSGVGINAQSDSVVTFNAVLANGSDGIQCSSRCTILNNSSSLTVDGAAIRAFGFNNRIEGNNCSYSGHGIRVDGFANVIIKNTCTTNTTDWTIAADNVVGPIMDRRSPGSAAINGFSAPDSTGSTHPQANFSY